MSKQAFLSESIVDRSTRRFDQYPKVDQYPKADQDAHTLTEAMGIGTSIPDRSNWGARISARFLP